MDNNKDLSLQGEFASTDQALQKRIANGEISKEHVERVWRATEDLSAQTPFEVRAAIVAMRATGYEMNPAEVMTLNTILDLRAALYKDESKFAHLVAGTETIVKTLQNINPLERRLDAQSADIGELREMVGALLKKVDELGKASRAEKPAPHHEDVDEMLQALDDPGDNIPLPEEQVDRRIGSAWAKQPEQGPLFVYKCAKGCNYRYWAGVKQSAETNYSCLVCDGPMIEA